MSVAVDVVVVRVVVVVDLLVVCCLCLISPWKKTKEKKSCLINKFDVRWGIMMR